MTIHALLLPLLLAPPPLLPDTIVVQRRDAAPVVDGRASDAEHGAPALYLETPTGRVPVWVTADDTAVVIAAQLPDDTFYWGDDLVVSVDVDGSGGDAPAPGDRQWYLRRVLDSSTVVTAVEGRWFPAGTRPAMLGARRAGDDWSVASESTASGWSVELRIARRALAGPGATPRIAFRTYNDAPHGWWAYPAPEGVPPQRVEHRPGGWAVLQLP